MLESCSTTAAVSVLLPVPDGPETTINFPGCVIYKGARVQLVYCQLCAKNCYPTWTPDPGPLTPILYSGFVRGFFQSQTLW